MGFIAALQAGLKRWTGQVAVGENLKNKAASLSKDTFRKAGRAVVPISLLLAKGLVKKLSGTSLEELTELLQGDAAADVDEIDKRGEKRGKVLDDAIDEYFSTSLEEHSKHIRAIDDFKSSASQLLTYLETNVKARLPVFIVIDELDRCRPDYAIELLEGVKHLFDVRGFCFCVSTNQNQLCESIKGVYGSGFDSRKYLKRFFSFEYVLPMPTDHAFARLLVPNSIIAGHGKVVSGLSDWHSTQNGENDGIARCFHFVAEAFRMPLRSQRQVFEIADAACAGIERGKPVHLLYLFGLAALWHVDRDTLINLPAKINREEASKRLSSLIDHNVTHPYIVVVSTDRLLRGERKETHVRFAELFSIYLQLANRDLREIRDAFYNSSSNHQYPKTVERALAEEMPSTFSPQEQYSPSIRSYVDLVRTAGQINESA